MDKKQAQAIVKSTLENPFDKNRFIAFIGNLLNSFEDSSFSHKGNLIPDAYEQHISLLERIGKYADGEHRIDILVVKLKKHGSIERARTMQRNFVARYLNGSRGGELKDAALVAFVAPNKQDWRFSLVKMDYRFEDGKDGRVKVTEEFTPARRWSFLVGSNERSHTAQTQLVPIIMDDQRNPTLEELEEAFNIEKATKEFFVKYRTLFLWTREELDKVVEADHKVKANFDKQKLDTVDFAKKLLGQIVFLYFLQKKGWFGVERDADWGTGPKNFLRLLFEKKVVNYRNFFNEISEPLFYEALAIERTDDFYSRFNCKIPFLNGGLFDPINNYDWVHTDILLPNELFSNSEKTKEGDTGTGILDVFDRYNFTVKEDEPLEKEVAVDPEMLGKVFENLLEVKDRKSKGTYYTPREIVHYMCQESLTNYLTTELEGKVAKEDIEILIQYGETVVENDSRVENYGRETERYSYKLPESIRKNAELLDEKLESICICDPAVGSGAFPVMMMTEIVRARNALTSYIKDKTNRTIYDFKRYAIQSCLYGVDIDPSAVEIAKLRLWLSLVVDEQHRKRVRALPNLDYKIMQGNSLLEEFEGKKLFDERFLAPVLEGDDRMERMKEKQSEMQQEYIQLHASGLLDATKKQMLEIELKKINNALKQLAISRKSGDQEPELFDVLSLAKKKAHELRRLHEEFFGAEQKAKKEELKKRIQDLEWELIEATLKEQASDSSMQSVKHLKLANTKPFFLWKLNFVEVFQEKGGFDAVIANPPYISHDKIQNKAAMKGSFRCYEPFADLYCYFIELALRLQNSKGLVCFITSNSYLRAKYGKPLRLLLREKNLILEIVNVERFQMFDAAIVNAAVLMCQNKYDLSAKPCFIVSSEYSGDSGFQEFVFQNRSEYSQEDFLCEPWSLVSREKLSIRKKIEAAGKSLAKYETKIRLGIATGANEAFIIDREKKHQLVKRDRRNEEIIRPVLRGRDIHRYRYTFNNRYIVLTKNGIDVQGEYPEIYRYLDSFGEDFKKRGARGKHWSNLRPCSFLGDFSKEKIIWIELSDRGRFALCSEEIYLLNTAYFLIPPKEFSPKFLLGLLNSKVIEFYLGLIAETSGMGTNRWINDYVKEFPVPSLSKDHQIGITEIVDEILPLTQSSDYLKNTTKQTRVKERESQIDQMVYNLYGLTPEEIAIVEQETGAASS